MMGTYVEHVRTIGRHHFNAHIPNILDDVVIGLPQFVYHWFQAAGSVAFHDAIQEVAGVADVAKNELLLINPVQQQLKKQLHSFPVVCRPRRYDTAHLSLTSSESV